MQCMNCGSQEFDILQTGAGRCRYCGNIIPGMARPAPSGIEREFNNMGNNLSAGRKDKWVAALLTFFLGCFGIQFFYIGETTKGIVCLVITLLLGWLYGLGLFITGIWSLIFLIQILTMSDQEFNQRFNGPQKL